MVLSPQYTLSNAETGVKMCGNNVLKLMICYLWSHNLPRFSVCVAGLCWHGKFSLMKYVVLDWI